MLLTILVGSVGWLGCNSNNSSQTDHNPRPVLADTLVAIFAEIKAAVMDDRAEDFVRFLDPIEAARLLPARKRRNGSLGSYLRHRLAGWPDPDTLQFEDLIHEPPYARVALSGSAGRFGYRQERVRYTFVLFKRQQETWRIAAVSSLEKERLDPYGTELSYLETELPPKLRFPRLF